MSFPYFLTARSDLVSYPAVVRRLRAAGCVFAEDEARLLIDEGFSAADLADRVGRRVAGLPLEHVLGWARFRDLRVAVDPGVFVPRHRTEFLAGQAVLLARARPDSDSGSGEESPVVVDLCCGSGALGAVVLADLDRVELHASDVDPAAVRCARHNLGHRGEVHQGDLFAPLPARLRGRVDVLVVNAPYVPTAAIRLLPPEARLHEPHVTLDGGADGLDVLRRVIAGAPTWLAPGGHLLVETGRQQAAAVAAAIRAAGLVARVAGSAELDATVVIGTAIHQP